MLSCIIVLYYEHVLVMDAALSNRVEIKIFIGFELTKGLDIPLNKNHLWKEAKVTQTTNLVEIPYQNKKYLGIFLSHEISTMQNLRENSKRVRDELQHYCGEIDLAQIKIHIFPQVFVA